MEVAEVAVWVHDYSDAPSRWRKFKDQAEADKWMAVRSGIYATRRGEKFDSNWTKEVDPEHGEHQER